MMHQLDFSLQLPAWRNSAEIRKLDFKILSQIINLNLGYEFKIKTHQAQTGPLVMEQISKITPDPFIYPIFHNYPGLSLEVDWSGVVDLLSTPPPTPLFPAVLSHGVHGKVQTPKARLVFQSDRHEYAFLKMNQIKQRIGIRYWVKIRANLGRN